MSESSPNSSELLFYQAEDGITRVQVRLEGPTVWMSQRSLSELFQKDVRTVNEHLQNVYEEGELQPEATIRKFRIVQIEGGRRVERLIDPSLVFWGKKATFPLHATLAQLVERLIRNE